MRAVAKAHQNRNLAEFEKALRDYRDGMIESGWNSFMNSSPFDRALIGPNDSIPPRGVVRHASRTESIKDS